MCISNIDSLLINSLIGIADKFNAPGNPLLRKEYPEELTLATKEQLENINIPGGSDDDFISKKLGKTFRYLVSSFKLELCF